MVRESPDRRALAREGDVGLHRKDLLVPGTPFDRVQADTIVR